MPPPRMWCDGQEHQGCVLVVFADSNFLDLSSIKMGLGDVHSYAYTRFN